jgi:2-dehydro-3-deoxyphosphooctonate aldolase (KDO 8-P synthase)
MTRVCQAGEVAIGEGQRLAVIAGPCVLESLELGMEIGRAVQGVCRELGLAYIFKASFDKANRSSIASARGPGLERGLEWMGRIRRELAAPVTTDIHEAAQAGAAAEAGVDLLQIPAFLCRQTDLLVAAGRAAAAQRCAVNVKKGQFVSPGEMLGPVEKLAEAGCTNVMLTERGTFFGYGRLVNDFLGLPDMMGLAGGGVPVCFDCTHSTQRPGEWGGGAKVTAGSKPGSAQLLARAAAAAGVHAVFLECHPDPRRALSDAATMLPLAEVPGLLKQLAGIRRALGAP